jgi:NAD(P)-dependent dehydrogenase (short-subunit alcohol dehydrogenase family)
MNSVALISGASRGIGRGIALELARVGHNLVINFAGNADGARKTAADCVAAAASAGKTIRAEICQGDVGAQKDRQKLIDFTRESFDRLDLLVNNAGITSIGRRDLLEAREDEFDALMAINLKGPYFLSQLAANWMIEQVRFEPARRPKIVTISSISGYAVSTNRGDYCLAKAALGMLTKLYATRLADHGINVYEVCPGVIASDMTAPVKEKYDQLFADGLAPIRRWGTPEDVGKAVAAIALDLLPYSTGEVINVDGGFHLRRL